MARKKKLSIFGTSWKGGSARKAIGGYLRKKAAKIRKRAGKYLKKGARRALRA